MSDLKSSRAKGEFVDAIVYALTRHTVGIDWHVRTGLSAPDMTEIKIAISIASNVASRLPINLVNQLTSIIDDISGANGGIPFHEEHADRIAQAFDGEFTERTEC